MSKNYNGNDSSTHHSWNRRGPSENDNFDLLLRPGGNGHQKRGRKRTKNELQNSCDLKFMSQTSQSPSLLNNGQYINRSTDTSRTATAINYFSTTPQTFTNYPVYLPMTPPLTLSIPQPNLQPTMAKCGCCGKETTLICLPRFINPNQIRNHSQSQGQSSPPQMYSCVSPHSLSTLTCSRHSEKGQDCGSTPDNSAGMCCPQMSSPLHYCRTVMTPRPGPPPDMTQSHHNPYMNTHSPNVQMYTNYLYPNQNNYEFQQIHNHIQINESCHKIKEQDSFESNGDYEEQTHDQNYPTEFLNNPEISSESESDSDQDKEPFNLSFALAKVSHLLNIKKYPGCRRRNRRIKTRNGKSHPIYSKKCVEISNQLQSTVNIFSNPKSMQVETTRRVKINIQGRSIKSSRSRSSSQIRVDSIDVIGKMMDMNNNDEDSEPDYPPERFNYFNDDPIYSNKIVDCSIQTKNYLTRQLKWEETKSKENLDSFRKDYPTISEKIGFQELTQKVDHVNTNIMMTLGRSQSDPCVTKNYDMNGKNIYCKGSAFMSLDCLMDYGVDQSNCHRDCNSLGGDINDDCTSDYDSVHNLMLDHKKLTTKVKILDSQEEFCPTIPAYKDKYKEHRRPERSIFNWGHQEFIAMPVIPMPPRLCDSNEILKKIIIKKCNQFGRHKVIVYKEPKKQSVMTMTSTSSYDHDQTSANTILIDCPFSQTSIPQHACQPNLTCQSVSPGKYKTPCPCPYSKCSRPKKSFSKYKVIFHTNKPRSSKYRVATTSCCLPPPCQSTKKYYQYPYCRPEQAPSRHTQTNGTTLSFKGQSTRQAKNVNGASADICIFKCTPSTEKTGCTSGSMSSSQGLGSCPDNSSRKVIECQSPPNTCFIDCDYDCGLNSRLCPIPHKIMHPPKHTTHPPSRIPKRPVTPHSHPIPSISPYLSPPNLPNFDHSKLIPHPSIPDVSLIPMQIPSFELLEPNHFVQVPRLVFSEPIFHTPTFELNPFKFEPPKLQFVSVDVEPISVFPIRSNPSIQIDPPHIDLPSPRLPIPIQFPEINFPTPPIKSMSNSPRPPTVVWQPPTYKKVEPPPVLNTIVWKPPSIVTYKPPNPSDIVWNPPSVTAQFPSLPEMTWSSPSVLNQVPALPSLPIEPVQFPEPSLPPTSLLPIQSPPSIFTQFPSPPTEPYNYQVPPLPARNFIPTPNPELIPNLSPSKPILPRFPKPIKSTTRRPHLPKRTPSESLRLSGNSTSSFKSGSPSSYPSRPCDPQPPRHKTFFCHRRKKCTKKYVKTKNPQPNFCSSTKIVKPIPGKIGLSQYPPPPRKICQRRKKSRKPLEYCLDPEMTAQLLPNYYNLLQNNCLSPSALYQAAAQGQPQLIQDISQMQCPASMGSISQGSSYLHQSNANVSTASRSQGQTGINSLHPHPQFQCPPYSLYMCTSPCTEGTMSPQQGPWPGHKFVYMNPPTKFKSNYNPNPKGKGENGLKKSNKKWQ